MTTVLTPWNIFSLDAPALANKLSGTWQVTCGRERWRTLLSLKNQPLIVGCTFQKVKSPCSIKAAGLAQLLRILVIELAYLIWVLRCKRMVQKDDIAFSSREVSGRWSKSISDRAALDRKITIPKSKKKARLGAIIRETWQDTSFEGSTRST